LVTATLTARRTDDNGAAMKVLFMGAPAFAVPTLMALGRTGAELSAVYTKAPKRAGRRGLEITKCPVHLAAESLGLRVETPSTLRDPQAQCVFSDFGADIAIVAAYGLLLPAEILAAPRLGCFNLHASLLPRWRGAAPVQRAIMAGDNETGVSIMKMEVGLDTGPIAGELRTAIDPRETSEQLTARLAEIAAKTIGDNWNALIGGELEFTTQRADGVEYAAKVSKAEAPIDWSASAIRVRNHIHGLSPFPGAVAGFQAGSAVERLKILRAEIAELSGRPGEILDDRMTIACAEGSIRALQVQRAGRKVISGVEFMRSGAVPPGSMLIPPP
jgi:methionyl-tRNA formyltransferase